MEDAGAPFEVRCSAAVAQSLRRLQEQASKEGRGGKVLRAMRAIVTKLENDPRSFGEPEFRLPAMRIQVRSGAVHPLVVHFGVCDDRPLVFIKKVILLDS